MRKVQSVSSSSSIHYIPIPTATGTAHAQPMDPPGPPLTAPASFAGPGPGPLFAPATAQEEETRQERVVIADAMDRLIESCQNDLWPPPAAARLLGLHSRDRNVEEARFACVEMAVTRHQVTRKQLVDAWMAGGRAFEELILGVPAIAASPFGQYCRRRGGLPGKAASVRPGGPDMDEQLPPIPGLPVNGGKALSLEEELTWMLRAEEAAEGDNGAALAGAGAGAGAGRPTV